MLSDSVVSFPQESNKESTLIISILQKRKLRPKEVVSGMALEAAELEYELRQVDLGP